MKTHQSAVAVRPLRLVGLEYLRHQARHENRRVHVGLRDVARIAVAVRVLEHLLRLLEHVEEAGEPHARDFLLVEEQILTKTKNKKTRTLKNYCLT